MDHYTTTQPRQTKVLFLLHIIHCKNVKVTFLFIKLAVQFKPSHRSFNPPCVGQYMYAEASGQAVGATATLSSPWMYINTQCTVRFAFYLYGDKPGTLFLINTDRYLTNTSVSCI